MNWLQLLDIIDIPSLGVAVAFGFWNVIKSLHTIDRRLVRVETLLEKNQ
jgi:hypothetical protein